MTSRTNDAPSIQNNQEPSTKQGPIARRELAVAMRAAGKSVTAIAEELDLKPNTISKWFAEPETAEMLQRFRIEALGESKDVLRGLSLRAVQALAEGLESPEAKDRIAAAKTILDRVGIVRVEKFEHEHKGKIDLSALTEDELLQWKGLMRKVS